MDDRFYSFKHPIIIAKFAKFVFKPGALAGATLGSLFGGFFLAFIGFRLYKWNKNKQELGNAMPTPGYEGYNNNIYGQEMIIIKLLQCRLR